MSYELEADAREPLNAGSAEQVTAPTPYPLRKRSEFGEGVHPMPLEDNINFDGYAYDADGQLVEHEGKQGKVQAGTETFNVQHIKALLWKNKQLMFGRLGSKRAKTGFIWSWAGQYITFFRFFGLMFPLFFLAYPALATFFPEHRETDDVVRRVGRMCENGEDWKSPNSAYNPPGYTGEPHCFAGRDGFDHKLFNGDEDWQVIKKNPMQFWIANAHYILNLMTCERNEFWTEWFMKFLADPCKKFHDKHKGKLLVIYFGCMFIFFTWALATPIVVVLRMAVPTVGTTLGDFYLVLMIFLFVTVVFYSFRLVETLCLKAIEEKKEDLEKGLAAFGVNRVAYGLHWVITGLILEAPYLLYLPLAMNVSGLFTLAPPETEGESHISVLRVIFAYFVVWVGMLVFVANMLLQALWLSKYVAPSWKKLLYVNPLTKKEGIFMNRSILYQMLSWIMLVAVFVDVKDEKRVGLWSFGFVMYTSLKSILLPQYACWRTLALLCNVDSPAKSLDGQGAQFGIYNAYAASNYGAVMFYLFLSIVSLAFYGALVWWFDLSHSADEEGDVTVRNSGDAAKVNDKTPGAEEGLKHQAECRAEGKAHVAIRDLKVYFPPDTMFGSNIKAVDGVDLSLRAGEVFCLLGHNGAGKSTVIKALAGLLKPSSGEIEFTANACAGGKLGHAAAGGKSTVTLAVSDAKERKVAYDSGLIGMCLQEDILWPEMVVEDHMGFLARLKGCATDEEGFQASMDDIIKSSFLEPHRHKKTRELSGGWKRILSTASAFVGDETQIIILDEPTAGVDPANRRNCWNFIKKKREEGKVILLTTHFMDEADILADRVAVMSEGLVKESGTKQALKDKFRCGYSLELNLKPLLSGEARRMGNASKLAQDEKAKLIAQVRALALKHLAVAEGAQGASGPGAEKQGALFNLVDDDADGKASVENKFAVTIKYGQTIAGDSVAVLLDALKSEMGLERVKMNAMNLEEVFVKVCLGVDPANEAREQQLALTNANGANAHPDDEDVGENQKLALIGGRGGKGKKPVADIGESMPNRFTMFSALTRFRFHTTLFLDPWNTLETVGTHSKTYCSSKNDF